MVIEQTLERPALGLRPRLVVAGWFALTACVPIIGFFGVIGRWFFFSPESLKEPVVVALFIGIPISMAAFLGFVIGSRILNEEVVSRRRSAAIHGTLVAILSYVGLVLAFAVNLALNLPVQASEAYASMLVVFGVGAILVGWLIIIAGAVSGWLLFEFSWSSLNARVTTWTSKTRAARMNVGAALVLLALTFACLLPGRRLTQRENVKEAERDFSHAVWINNAAQVEEFLSRGMSADLRDTGGSPLLLIAAENGGTRIVKILLVHGANPNVANDVEGHQTPLHFAVSNFDVESIKALLEHGANVNVTDDYGRTPLMLAATMTDRDTVRLLIEQGANVQAMARDGSTALSMAKKQRDLVGRRDRSELATNEGVDVGRNFSDSRDYENPAIIQRARERHGAIIELLKTYEVK